jgi:hypothetical protein
MKSPVAMRDGHRWFDLYIAQISQQPRAAAKLNYLQ